MKFKNLITLLYSYGAHIGFSSQSTSSLSYNYLLGFYKNRAIINLKTTIISIRKSLSFLNNKNVVFKLLLHISSLFVYPIEMRHSFAVLVYFKYKQSVIEDYWYPALIGNIVNVNEILLFLYKILRKNKIFYFDLLSRTILYTYSHRIFGISYNKYFKKIIRFWRIFYVFKYFKYNIKLPDCLILLNTLNTPAIANDINRLYIPIIGTVDTNMSYNGITYPIYCNNKSILFAYFISLLTLNTINMKS
jgi:ribosomal protein S2